MNSDSPTKSSNTVTPTRPRTRSVSSRECFELNGYPNSMNSEALAFERDFDAGSFVDGAFFSYPDFQYSKLSFRFSISDYDFGQCVATISVR